METSAHRLLHIDHDVLLKDELALFVLLRLNESSVLSAGEAMEMVSVNRSLNDIHLLPSGTHILPP